jgi:hypothetical protein
MGLVLTVAGDKTPPTAEAEEELTAGLPEVGEALEAGGDDDDDVAARPRRSESTFFAGRGKKASTL